MEIKQREVLVFRRLASGDVFAFSPVDRGLFLLECKNAPLVDNDQSLDYLQKLVGQRKAYYFSHEKLYRLTNRLKNVVLLGTSESVHSKKVSNFAV